MVKKVKEKTKQKVEHLKINSKAKDFLYSLKRRGETYTDLVIRICTHYIEKHPIFSPEFDKLPVEFQRKVKTIIKERGIPKTKVMEKYEEVFNLDFITTAPTEEIRHLWTTNFLDSFFKKE